MMVTVFADASHCPHTKAGGWGAWAKRDGWVRGLTFGGPISATVLNAAEAEMAPMANALSSLHASGHLNAVQTVMLQSDCLRVLQLVRKIIPSTRVANHEDSAEIQLARIHPSKNEMIALRSIVEAVGQDRIIYVRHVRGHQQGQGRNWVNRTCDAIARRHMREQRARLQPERSEIRPTSDIPR